MTGVWLVFDRYVELNDVLNWTTMKIIKMLRNSLLACASVVAMAAMADEAAIRKNLGERIPQFQKIDEITKSVMPGLFEVRVNGTDIFYTDSEGNFLIQGSLIDTKLRRNLTEERVDKLTAVAFDTLPLKDAFTIVRGNGTEKSKNIWCAKDKAKAWTDWMVRDQAAASAPPACDASALARNVALGKKHKITGTPTLIFVDGSRVPGAIDAAQVEKFLAEAKN